MIYKHEMLKTRVYSNSGKYNVLQILHASIKGYKSSLYLAKQLAKRDVKAQYRQSLLGVLWALIPVFINALVWILLQRSGAVKLTDTPIPYPVYVLIGTTIWSIFGECLAMPITTVNANIGIITKINFEKEALITLGFLKLLFNLFIKMGLIILVLSVNQIMPSSSILLFLPLLLLTMLFFVGIGTLLAPIGVLYADISRMMPIVMQLLMYTCPVLYVLPKEGFLRQIMMYNPLSYFIIDVRNTLTGFDVEHWFFWLGAFVFSGVIALLAMLVYRVSMPIITERMSA